MPISKKDRVCPSLFLSSLFLTLLTPPPDPARAQESRQGRHPRARQGQRLARQGSEADIHRRLSQTHRVLEHHLWVSYGAKTSTVPELPPRNRKLEQSPARGPRAEPRSEAVAQGEVLAE